VFKKQIEKSAFERDPKEILATARFISGIDHPKGQLSPGIFYPVPYCSSFTHEDFLEGKLRPPILDKTANLSCVERLRGVIGSRVRNRVNRNVVSIAKHNVPRRI